MEKWKEIKGYEGYYEISDLGRVKSLARSWYSTSKRGNPKKCGTPEKILKPADNGTGYMIVNLSKNGKTKMKLVHRLVAEAFIENANNYPQVNHKDEDKTNNNAENLEWVTCIENLRYGTRSKRESDTKCYIINQYDLQGNFIREWLGARKIEKELGIKNQGICMCCNGKLKTSGGYIWRYKHKEV